MAGLIPVADLKTANEVIANIRAVKARIQARQERIARLERLAKAEEAKKEAQRLEEKRKQENAIIAAYARKCADEYEANIRSQVEAMEAAVCRLGDCENPVGRIRYPAPIGPRVNPSAVIYAVSDLFGVDFDDIVGACKKNEYVRARRAAMWLVYKLTRYSLPRIGMIFGNRDHTTVLHAVRKVNSVIDGEFIKARQYYSAVAEIARSGK